MIIFSWTLTPNQILALRDVADHHRRYEEAAAKKKCLGPDRLDQHNLKHWIGAVRHLIKEGFISHKEVPLKPWERGIYPSTSGMRQSWEITAKGLLMLQLVEIEVTQQAQVLKLDKSELKLLQSTAA